MGGPEMAPHTPQFASRSSQGLDRSCDAGSEAYTKAWNKYLHPVNRARCLPRQHPPRIERVTHPITDVVDREHSQENSRAREERPVLREVEVVLRIEEDPPPGGDVRRKPQP